jgi:hypothetical protein
MEQLRLERSEAEALGRDLVAWITAEAVLAVQELDENEQADGEAYAEVDVALPFGLRIGLPEETRRPRICCLVYPNGDFTGDCCPEKHEED